MDNGDIERLNRDVAELCTIFQTHLGMVAYIDRFDAWRRRARLVGTWVLCEVALFALRPEAKP